MRIVHEMRYIVGVLARERHADIDNVDAVSYKVLGEIRLP
jgi:hypothetical protein